MSEAKRVKGWAVKRDSHHCWLKVAVNHGGLWDKKSARAVFATRDEACVAKANVANYNLGVKVVRIVAKPKAPKPDKLEQAIAAVKHRMQAHASSEENWVAQKRWAYAETSSVCKRECKSVIDTLAALR